MSTVPLLATGAEVEDKQLAMRRCKSLNTLVLEKCGSQRAAAAVWTLSPLLIGLVLGIALPTSCALPYPWNKISQIIGWVSVVGWCGCEAAGWWAGYRVEVGGVVGHHTPHGGRRRPSQQMRPGQAPEPHHRSTVCTIYHA